ACNSPTPDRRDALRITFATDDEISVLLRVLEQLVGCRLLLRLAQGVQPQRKSRQPPRSVVAVQHALGDGLVERASRHPQLGFGGRCVLLLDRGQHTLDERAQLRLEGMVADASLLVLTVALLGGLVCGQRLAPRRVSRLSALANTPAGPGQRRLASCHKASISSREDSWAE